VTVTSGSARHHVRQAIALRDERLLRLSHRIHALPELAFEEENSSRWVAEELADAGFAVERPAYELPTAFVARAGHGPLHVAICAEYDALPGIGHACGHNIIASCAVGAGLALVELADDVGLTVEIIGTPAEECGDGGGKILLLERGAFREVHFALMVHPAPYDVASPQMIAASLFDVQYTGKAAHAASWPELGVNALDALTVAQTAIGLIRQHILPTDKIHGIITRGGDAHNVIPAQTAARYMVRSAQMEDLGPLRERVLRCFEAGAIATGSHLSVLGGLRPYAPVLHDHYLAAIYEHNAEELGRSFRQLGRPSGSTDMGNVSTVVPSIHPFIGIESGSAVNHQPEFTACCVSAAADRAVLDGAIALAWTALDVAQDDLERQRLMDVR
jgi:amidohydrolase